MFRYYSLISDNLRMTIKLAIIKRKSIYIRILNDITKQRKFQRCSTLKPVEPAVAILEIFKNLMSFSIVYHHQ
jgi:hypothetical protein